jgi:hypothetical protein
MRLEAYVKQLEDVIDAATDGRHPLVDGREGAATTEMLEAAEHSASTGLAVFAPALTPAVRLTGAAPSVHVLAQAHPAAMFAPICPLAPVPRARAGPLDRAQPWL